MVHYSLSFTVYKAASGGVSLRCGTPRTLQKHVEVGQGPCKACWGRLRTLPSMLRSCKVSLHILGSHKRLTQMLPFAHWPVRVQGIGEDMPSNMLSFINFESLGLYWTYLLALQTTTPKNPPIRLMSLDHEPKMRCYAMSSNYGP